MKTGTKAVLRFLPACFAFLIYGCAGTFWTPVQFDGPLIEGNKRAKTFYSCDDRPMGLSDARYCLVAVEDHKGRKVQTDRDIGEVLNSYLASVPTLSKWAPTRKDGTSAYVPGGFPYDLYLLTISPIVVLAVPHVHGDRWDDSRGPYDSTVYLRATQRPIFQHLSPPIRSGSFWFSPDLKVNQQELPITDQHYSIPLDTSVLEFTAEASLWKVSRPTRQK